jgi:Uma2 family endonuclease
MLHLKSRQATYADIEALPPNIVGEIVHGVLYAHPRPAPKHGVASNALTGVITPRFGHGGEGGGRIFMDEPELHLGPHVVVPDIAGWRRERLTPFPETAFVATAPDWLCEVLSPSTQAIDRTDKLGVYAAYGVKHCWYVDPTARTLEVLQLTGDKWLLEATFKDADTVAAPPFEVHSFSLALLWVD